MYIYIYVYIFIYACMIYNYTYDISLCQINMFHNFVKKLFLYIINL